VLLEAHVGAFTRDGTYLAVIERLDHLAETGITALELMPLADFAGSRNWGYDGVLWYAPDSAYGRPDELKTLIDEAHLRGLMVFLDVVYNHFGPEGNYLGRYAPSFFTDAETPWGRAIDYRVPQVRAFAIENALYWLEKYRFDGLRLDAVHAIAEPDRTALLHDLNIAVGGLASRSGRHIHLVLENDDNRASLLDPLSEPPRGKYRAQWNDDYHHAWHVALTGESQGTYRDYRQAPLSSIARSLASGFVYQGGASEHRKGKSRGERSDGLSPMAFVNFLQNHDQIGNRAFGERLEVLTKSEAIEAALAITLLMPAIPMLFMGEEWGSKVPFPFFCDFKGDLAEAVRRGRQREYGFASAEAPDPLAEATFRSANLDWDSRTSKTGQARLALVRHLLALRQSEIVPRLAGVSFGDAHAADNGLLTAHWHLGDGTRLRLAANLSEGEIDCSAKASGGVVIFGDTPGKTRPPWSVLWSTG